MTPRNDKTNAKRSISLVFGTLLLVALCASLAIGTALAAPTTAVSNEAELRAAVAKGSAAGDIKLAANITLNETLNFSKCTAQGESGGKTVTIDLAGHNLSLAAAVASNNAVILVPADYTFTLRDSSGTNAGSITGGARGIVNSGAFTLATGGIRNNGGAYDGAGIYNNANATITITGGVIENNTVSKGYDGAGIFNRGQIQITGGIIQNNKAADTSTKDQGRGGGIYNGTGGNLTIMGGTIQGNSAWRGGGVYNKQDCEVMVFMNKPSMTNNSATSDGGGIYNAGDSKEMKLAIVGGTISGNTSGGNGGGISTPGIMAASDGVIENNSAANWGGGIYVSGELSLSDSIKVQNNKGAKGFEDDTYLTSGKKIIIEAPFSRKAHVGIACEDHDQVFTKNYEKYHAGVDPNKYFFANPCCYQNDVRLLWDDGEQGARNLRCLIVIHYQDANGGDHECADYKDVKPKEDDWGKWGKTTWYVVRHSTDLKAYAKVEGDVNLILCTDATLKTGGIGILRKDDKGTRAKLTIWNSTGGEGYLIADSDDWDDGHAGIGYKKNSGGVGSLVINGGNIKALGGDDAAGIGGVENRGNGPITINGGYVEAHGGKWGAGIGGGQGGNQDNPIRINGGTVKAYGGKYAAGIGGGDSDRGGADGGKVVIKNATVYAQGGSRGAGIGGGEDGEGCDVTIINSNVEAHGGGKGAGIGGGQDSEDGGTLTVESGTVKAYGGFQAAGIGGGEDSCGGTFIANGGTILARAGDECATGIGAGHGDYHEGTKKLYDRAKVTSSRSRTDSPDNVRPADQRLEGLTWQSVLIQPCDHMGSAAYRDVDFAKHAIDGNCQFCGFKGQGFEEKHSFNGDTHKCLCGHVEDPIVVVRNDQTAPQTTYASRGSSYKLASLGVDSAGRVFDGWKVAGLDLAVNPGITEGEVLTAGKTLTVGLAAGSDKITLTAQWSEAGAHTHYLTRVPAKEPTCTDEGNTEYWVCDQGEHPCGRYYTDAQGNNAISADAVVVEPLGHEWGEATSEWSADRTSCTATHVCQRNASHTESVTSTSVFGPVTKPASCTEDGGTYYLALFFGKGDFRTQRLVDNFVPATGHKWSAVTYTWADDYSTCTATRTCENDPEHQETETVRALVSTTQPTCTPDGTTTYTAVFKNPAFEMQEVVIEGPNAQGHTWLEPTYEWSSDGRTCIATRVCANNENHVETEDAVTLTLPIRLPTCTEPGESVSVAKFFNTAFASQTTTTPIPATGHDWGEWEVVQPSSELTKGLKRRVCTNDPSHIEEQVIPLASHEHVPTKVEAKAATCTEPGNIEYWKCTGGEDPCYLLFEDGWGKHQLNEDETVVPATGHHWRQPSYTWSKDRTVCTAVRLCTNNALHFQIELAEPTSKVVLQPTCEQMGMTLYTVEFKNKAFASRFLMEATDALGHAWSDWEQTKAPTCTEAGEVQRVCEHDSSHVETRTVAALSHDWTDWTVVKPATATEEGIEERICKNDQTHTETRAIPKTGHVHVLAKADEKPATCTEPGIAEHWACTGGDDPCGRLFKDAKGAEEVQASALAVEALGHDWNEPTYEWDDNTSCTATRTCARDASHKETETVEPTVVVDKQATCESEGQETYTAVFQNKAFTTLTKIVETGKLDHTPSAFPARRNILQPTCTDPGSYDSVTVCSSCGTQIGESVKETLAPLGHSWGAWVQKTAPTCTMPGEEERVCNRTFPNDDDGELTVPCGAKQTRPVEATGHDWGDWAPDPDNPAAAKRTCKNDPTHIETRSIGECPHDVTWNDHVDPKDPTCPDVDNPQFGNKEYWYCVVCSRFFIRAEEGEQSQKETKTEDGQTTISLKEVDFWKDIYIPVGHEWDEGVVDPEPTCTTEGVRTYHCKHAGCKATVVESVAPTGHTPGERTHVDLLKPTCKTPGFGWDIQYCASPSCKQALSVQLVTTQATGHVWGDWVVEKQATETEDGKMTRVCRTDPSHTETIIIGALGHAWGKPTYTWADDLSTCTATHTCKRCNETETETAQSVRVVTKEPTCLETGLVSYTAAFENESFETQSEKAMRVDALGHDWGEWDVVKPATRSSEGFQVRTCKRCNEVDAQVIPITGPEKTDFAKCSGAAKSFGFTDLDPDGWYMNLPDGNFQGTDALFIDYAVWRGLMSGYEGTTLFGPDDPLTRAMAATIIYRMATGATSDTTDNSVGTQFSDVPAGQWYSAAIAWCSENGVVTGYKGTGRFGPDDLVTREQLTTMIRRCGVLVKGQEARTADLTRFSDQGQMSDWALDGISHCVAYGIVKGYTDGSGRFGPQDNATRCQMAKIIAVAAYLLE